MTFNISDPATQALLVFLVIGLVAGWLASKLLGGGGLIRNLVIGVMGAFVGGYIVKTFNINFGLGAGYLNQIAAATLGAVVVIVVAKLVR